MGQVTVVDIGKNVLHLSDKKINAWLALQQEDTRVDGNQKKEEENGVDLITLDAGDEDEVMLLEERKANEEEDREAKEEAEAARKAQEEALRKAKEEEAALLNAKKEAVAAAKKAEEEEKLKEREEEERT